jgi:para-nitrobenzyl esterase
MPRLHAFLAALLPLAAAVPDTVKTDAGQVAGVPGKDPAVRAFKGIPFATPPVGDLRWRAPKAATHWDGVRKADQFSATCMQTEYAAGSLYRSEPQPVSEDCLYLNVWTAAKAAGDKRPVMVWIHGGALTRGSGSTPTYDGEELARKGVVLVTVNYRLGVFGFFAHPELTKESDRNASGNYGLLDQIAALEWVKKNIAAFGGDPNRVTIFGESAGSWSVNLLMASPLAKGLFQRVIGESGAQFGNMRKLADAEQAGVKFGQTVHAETLAALRAKPADELLKAQGGASPNVDGWFLPEDVRTIFASGKQSDVPLMAGSNADEGTAFVAGSTTAQVFQNTARQRFGAKADEYLKIYPASTDEEARKSAPAVMRDQTFGWEMRTWAREQTKTGKSKVYMFYFSRVPPGPGSEKYGAYHASEIAYAFHNLAVSTRPWEETDRKLSDLMSTYWVNFATTGNPNGKGLPAWPAYDAKADQLIELGDKVQVRGNPHAAALDFLDAQRK